MGLSQHPHQQLSHNFRSMYFSSLLNTAVTRPDGTRFGTLNDLVALNDEHPKIVACLIKRPDGRLEVFEWEGFALNEEDHKYNLVCRKEYPLASPANAVYLNKHILDKQIVDMNGRKVVRVNDVRLAFVSGGVFPIAVDVGVTGFLRRLGIVEIANGLFGVFNRTVPSRLILWNDIGVLALEPGRNIKLSVTHAKLNTLHPSDLSDIIEDLDAKTRTALFQSLDHEKAADVLEEMEEDVKADLVEDLPVEKAADVLEKMPSDEVADILDDLEEEKSEQLLLEMDKATSAEVRELMEYDEDTVGSIMTTDFLAFQEETRPDEILTQLRKLKPEADAIYAIYVTDAGGHLIGEVSLRDLVVHDLDIPLSMFMNSHPVYVRDTDNLDALMRLIQKYSLLAVPVVSMDMKLLGTIVIDDIVYQVLRRKRRSL